MRILLRTFKGELAKPLELPGSLQELKETAGKSFGKESEGVTILRRGKRVLTEEAYSRLGLKDGEVIVVAFGRLQELERHMMKSDQEGVLQVGQETKLEHQGSSVDKPEVVAMLNDPKFKKSKEQFQSDPSKWEAIHAYLVRIFPGAASFCINEKDTLKKILSQTDFGGIEEVPEAQEQQLTEERELTAQELEEVNELMALNIERDEVMAAYLKVGRNATEAANILLSSR